MAEPFDADGTAVHAEGVDTCDSAWPEHLVELGTFAESVATAVAERGYCYVQMGDSSEHRDKAVSAIRDHGEWALPKRECQESFLGQFPAKIAWLFDEPEFEPFNHYSEYIWHLGSLLEPLAEDHLGFRAKGLTNMMARAALSSPTEMQELQPGALDRSDVESGVVEQHLDFVRRRRVCLMYVIEGGGGTILLLPREDLGIETVRLPILKDRLLIFRHDLMNYAYMPKDSSDLALVSWLMEEPAKLRLDSIEGDQLRMEAILHQGPAVPPPQQVHVMCAFTNFPGRAKGCGAYWTGQLTDCDGFTEIPYFRWDISQYWDPTGNHPSKSKVRHSGLLSDLDIMSFDNAFFGLDPEAAVNMAPGSRLLLEDGFAAFHTLGYTRETLRGHKCAITLANSGQDWDFFQGYAEDKEAWARFGGAGFNCHWVALMAHALGTVGPTRQIDTACSSALVASNTVFAMLKRNKQDGYKYDDVKMGMACGAQNNCQPWPFVGLSKAGMLGPTGRTKFADNSADGYARSEGVGGVILEVTEDPRVTKDRLAVYTGGYINQDGRSASLTAPNGPSQQACIRGSLRDANQAPEETQCNENHGTGTAIGDPIETGSVRACFRKNAFIPVTAGKSHTGHLEAAAGIVSLIKSLLQAVSGAVPANCHLLNLNAHIDMAGWPGLFPNELTDLGTPNVCAGLCSFGFGGTNTRADVWGTRLPGCGANNTGTSRQLQVRDMAPELDCVLTSCAQCGGNMCWLCGEVPRTRDGERHHCAAIREELASYDICSKCYTGSYKHGAPTQSVSVDGLAGEQLYLVGSWNRWSEPVELKDTGKAEGVFEGEVAIGETRMEHFHLVVGDRNGRAIFPATSDAGPEERILGPKRGPQHRSWQINGRRDGKPAGTVYKIRFCWGHSARGTQTSIAWEATDKHVPVEERSRHLYSVVSSATGWESMDMRESPEDPRVWEFIGKISGQTPDPSNGPGFAKEMFYILRDHKEMQALYPLTVSGLSEIPAFCPVEASGSRGWEVFGKPGQDFKVQLAITDSALTVTTLAPAVQNASRCELNGALDYYFAVGSWDNGGDAFTEMTPDSLNGGVWRCHFVVGGAGREEFHISVNKSPRMLLHPSSSGAAPGGSAACGPDSLGRGINWMVSAPQGTRMELTLDLAAESALEAVTCRPLDAGRAEGRA